MQRVTVSLDDELLVELDRFAETRGYANRSEAVRDLCAVACSSWIPAIQATANAWRR